MCTHSCLIPARAKSSRRHGCLTMGLMLMQEQRCAADQARRAAAELEVRCGEAQRQVAAVEAEMRALLAAVQRHKGASAAKVAQLAGLLQVHSARRLVWEQAVHTGG